LVSSHISLLHNYVHHRAPHSFPTRRSSDLFRPYAMLLLVDFLIAVSLWGLLAAFKALTKLVPVNETAGTIIGIIHSGGVVSAFRSEEHTSELQSQSNLVCRLLLEKKNN